MGRTTLDDDTYARCVRAARRYLDKETSIKNQSLRLMTGINYDQAIKFFARATKEGFLDRHGRGSGTKYVIAGGRR